MKGKYTYRKRERNKEKERKRKLLKEWKKGSEREQKRCVREKGHWLKGRKVKIHTKREIPKNKEWERERENYERMEERKWER